MKLFWNHYLPYNVNNICFCIIHQALKTIVLGSSTQVFIDEWLKQSLTFSERPDIKYGLVQKKVSTILVKHDSKHIQMNVKYFIALQATKLVFLK